MKSAVTSFLNDINISNSRGSIRCLSKAETWFDWVKYEDRYCLSRNKMGTYRFNSKVMVF